MAGRTNNLVTENYDLIVTKTDNTGFIQWSKVFKSRLWGHGDGSSSYYVLEDLKGGGDCREFEKCLRGVKSGVGEVEEVS